MTQYIFLRSKSFTWILFLLIFGIASVSQAQFQTSPQDPYNVKEKYKKSEHTITMRDGVKLFVSVYSPIDQSQKYPILLMRTPYSVAPYGSDAYKETLGPSVDFIDEGYIFAYEDVRGRFMSEGEYSMMRPYIPNKSGNQIDESSDTYDTIEWLVKNIPNNNGKVGMWGISYPGFYTVMGVIDSHPALKAASPQAPIADMFIGDDFHHNGAFFLPHAFRFLSVFGLPREGLTTQWPPFFQYGTPDGYQFFLALGPLANANKKYFHNNIKIWNDYMNHPNYDEYWKAQNVLPHLKNVGANVMTVGGWFDSEDAYAYTRVYRGIEKNNPNIDNTIVIGPWIHGGWSRTKGDHLGSIQFDYNTSIYFQRQVQLPFFNYYLKGKGNLDIPEALVFETGRNKWHSYDTWPPENIKYENLYLQPNFSLSFSAPQQSNNTFDEYTSDPSKPVPFTQEITTSMGHEFMVEDQRFVAGRPDVLVYESEPLSNDVTIAGPIKVNLVTSTSRTDSDWIVKLIDVYPDNAPNNQPNPDNVQMGGYQMLLSGEVMRAKYRNSYENPQPTEPGKITEIKFELRNRYHTFLKGHKIMVQVQSTWFPLVDRNPQKFVNIYEAEESDFQTATQKVYHSDQNASFLSLPVLIK